MGDPFHQSILFVGVGSPHGWDRLGWSVAESLRQNTEGLAIRQTSSPSRLLDWLDGIDALHVGDAFLGKRAVPRLHCEPWPTRQFAQQRAYGTHELGLLETLQLASTLGMLPPTTLWAMEVSQEGIDPDPCEFDEVVRQMAMEIRYAIGR